MDDNILRFVLESFEIKSQNNIYYIKHKSYITYGDFITIIRNNYGNLTDYEIEKYVTNLILYYTNDIDMVFDFFSKHLDVEYIAYYNTI
jgi:hypothetical protein